MRLSFVNISSSLVIDQHDVHRQLIDVLLHLLCFLTEHEVGTGTTVADAFVIRVVVPTAFFTDHK